MECMLFLENKNKERRVSTKIQIVAIADIVKSMCLGKGDFMEKIEEKKIPIIPFVIYLLGGYIVTGGLLLLLAFALYKLRISENTVSIIITLIYIVSTFLMGLVAGKKMKNKKFLWGLALGCTYFLILVMVSFLVNESLKDVTNNLLTSFLLCGGSGMLGGMLS